MKITRTGILCGELLPSDPTRKIFWEDISAILGSNCGLEIKLKTITSGVYRRPVILRMSRKKAPPLAKVLRTLLALDESRELFFDYLLDSKMASL